MNDNNKSKLNPVTSSTAKPITGDRVGDHDCLGKSELIDWNKILDEMDDKLKYKEI